MYNSRRKTNVNKLDEKYMNLYHLKDKAKQEVARNLKVARQGLA